ncbi:MAG: diguanylate cyclase [Granulosicoccus sp.]
MHRFYRDVESGKTTAVQLSANEKHHAEEVEANAKLERRQLDMLMMHALKISGGDLSMLLSPGAIGDYPEQFVTLEAAALCVHEKGYRSTKNPLKSRHANSVAQQVMRLGVIKQGSVNEFGLPVRIKDNCSLVSHFVMIPVDVGMLPCPMLLVINPKVSLSGKLTDERLSRLHQLASVVAKRRLERVNMQRAVSPLNDNGLSDVALKQLAFESRHAIVTVNIDGQIQSLNPAAATLLSCKSRQAVGEELSRYLSPKYFMPTLERLSQSQYLRNKTEKLRLNHRSVTVLDESGDVKSVATSAYYSVVDGQISVTFVFSHPSAIRRSLLGQTSIANVVNTGSIGVVELDANWQCENANTAWSQLSGLSPKASEGMGWTQAIYEEDLMDVWLSLGSMQAKGEPYSSVWRIKKPRAAITWLAVHASAVVNELNHTTGYLFVCQDVSSVYESRERLKKASTLDALTGLMNRAEFLGQIQLNLNRRNQRSKLSLLVANIDGLKEVNDTLGQGVGDEALRQVSKKLRSSLGNDTICGRLNGKQFAVGLLNSQSPAVVANTIKSILDSTGKNFDIYGHSVLLNLSVGFACADKSTDSCDELLKQAQKALHQAQNASVPKRLKPAAKMCDRDFSKTEYLSPIEPHADDFSIACLLRNPAQRENKGRSNFDVSLIRKLCKQDDVLELS